MRIEFVNHACYIIEAAGVKLMTDPWLEGPAFHNGWALIEPTQFTYERFSEITHIWFSHEHPDHFSPPNLKKIPEALRAQIVVLFQETKDRKVAEYCRRLGFKEVRELGIGWEEVSPGFEVINRPHTDGDSWMCVRTEGKYLLNVNDCNLETDAEVKAIYKAIGHAPDVLFTQFSYANAIGNSGDTALRAQFAQAKIDEVLRQIRILTPRYVVPFASFVWFCHEENFFRNDAINTVDTVRAAIDKTDATAVVLFNGDQWTPGAVHDNGPAIAKWAHSYSVRIQRQAVVESVKVSPVALEEVAGQFLKRLLEKNSFMLRFWLEPTWIYVRDLEQAYKLSMRGFNQVDRPESGCDVALSSEALSYCFRFEWGGSTTRINGRYEVPPSGKFSRFKRYFLVSQLNNQGETFGVEYAGAHVLRRLKMKV